MLKVCGEHSYLPPLLIVANGAADGVELRAVRYAVQLRDGYAMGPADDVVSGDLGRTRNQCEQLDHTAPSVEGCNEGLLNTDRPVQ